MFKKFISVLVCFSVFSTIVFGWTAPVPISELNTQYTDTLPFLSSDGLSLYFLRNSTDTFYYSRVYQATRTQPSGSFSNVQEISSLNYSGGHIGRPWVSSDNLRMYYLRTEPGSVWRIKYGERTSTGNTWQAGNNVMELNALGQVSCPTLSADELTIAFTITNGNGGLGSHDIVIGTRTNNSLPFSHFVYQNAINSSFGESDMFLSPDAMSIYFSSNRNGISQLFKAHRNNLTENFSNLEQLSFFDSPGAALSGPMISNNGTEFYFSKSINGSPWDMYVSYIPEPGSICLFFSGIFILKIKNKYYQR